MISPFRRTSIWPPRLAKAIFGACVWSVAIGMGTCRADTSAADRQHGAASAALDASYLGFTYDGLPNGSRFFAGRLTVVNRTSEPITIKPRDISLRVDGTDFKLREITGSLQNHIFRAGGQNVEIARARIRLMLDLRVAAGGSDTKWIVFGKIPAGGQVPTIVLRVRIGEKTFELNANEAARTQMGMKVERIGPRGSLALLTIAGELNTVNIGSLTEVLESMAAQNVVRVVIRFTATATPLDGQVLNWLEQGAYYAGRGESNNPQMPGFPSAIRELHLARLPNRSTWSPEGGAGPPSRIHKTDVDAVRAALKSGFEVLRRDELLAEIENGHPLSRLAALAEGGGRLAAEDLPLVLKYADGSDPKMQLAALSALRHFGERAAVDKLLAYARKNSEPTVSMAIESLAASRYAAAHRALLDVLKKEHPASRKLIVRVLAKYPRPIWSDTIYSFISDSEPEVAVEALRALVQVGHAGLFDALNNALAHGSAPVREEAFQLLASRNDRQSEERALEFTLESMKHAPPSPTMYALLNRTKDARAVPLLLALLDESAGNRIQIIGSLAQIGDQGVADSLANRYASFPDRDKTATLQALQLLKSDHFRRLAGEALLQNDTSLVSAAVTGLQNDGSPQAIHLLVRALETSNNPTVWSHITGALANFGTAESKAALNKARDSGNSAKRSMAVNALRTLRLHSPAYPYCLQAHQSAKNERWDEAISRYSSAIEIDPELPDSFSGRGHAYLQKKKLTEAHQDFSKAIKLDPYNSEAVTGLGICLVQEGQTDVGIKTVETFRPRMNDDAFYTYNAGCVYGRALEQALKEPKSPEREKKIAAFHTKAISDLRRSVKLGFPDLEWMKKDPDLDSLHGAADFKKIVAPDAPFDDKGSPDAAPGDDTKAPGKAKSGKGKNRGDASGGISKAGDSLKADLLFENARP